MKTFLLKSYPHITIIIGILAVLAGMSDDKIIEVFGGGLFMALGVAFFVLKNEK